MPRASDDRPAGEPVLDAGRERILTAARDVLRLDDLADFSVDAVAKRAGVTRMTVYNRFGSRAKLLAELFDLLMDRGAFRDMPAVFTEPDPGRAVDRLVAILGRFYTENRSALVSLSAAAGSDPDLDNAMQSRHSRRRHVLEALVLRVGDEHRPAVPRDELVNTADVLVGFPTFNALAGPSRTPSDVVPLVQQLMRGLLGLAQPVEAAKGKKGRARKRKR